MLSVYPGTPGFRQQIPRTQSSMFTPACDASAKTVKEAEFIGGKYNVPVYVTALEKTDIGKLCGKETAVIAVTDKGFAEGFRKIIS